jgi:hypothetical protein
MISAVVGTYGGGSSCLLSTDGSGFLLLTDGSDLVACSVSFFSGFFLARVPPCSSSLISSFWRFSCFCKSSVCRSRRSIFSESDGDCAATESHVSRQLATSAPPIAPCRAIPIFPAERMALAPPSRLEAPKPESSAGSDRRKTGYVMRFSSLGVMNFWVSPGCYEFFLRDCWSRARQRRARPATGLRLQPFGQSRH